MGDDDDYKDLDLFYDTTLTTDEKEIKLGELLENEYAKKMFTSTEPYSDYEQYGDKTKLPLTIQEALEIAQELNGKKIAGNEVYDKMKNGRKVRITKKSKKAVVDMAEYYGKILFTKKLIDVDSLTEWQTDLATFLADITRPMEERWTGLCISLPRFYKVDQIKESIVVENPKSVELKHRAIVDADHVGSLTFLKSYEEKTRARQVKTWVFNTKNNNLANYSVEMKDISKIEMMDFIISANSTFLCRYSAHSRRFIGDVYSLCIDALFFSGIADYPPFLTEKD